MPGPKTKPMIYNRNYDEDLDYFPAEPPWRRLKRSHERHLKPWAVFYGNDDHAIAATHKEAVEELIRLQWAGQLPEPGDY